MEQLIGTKIDVSLIVGILIKILLVIVCLISLLTVKQTSVMDKVVDVPIGGWFKVISWIFFLVVCFVSLLIILVL
jgi:hypothetical protein